MKQHRVVDTISFDEGTAREASLDTAGGWFNFARHHAPREYFDAWSENHRSYVIALRDWIVGNNIRRGGFWHQSEGVPVFEDGTVALFSMRAWGDLLAAIWSAEDSREYSYVDFAWYTNDEEES